jgi:hypothetical protein
MTMRKQGFFITFAISIILTFLVAAEAQTSQCPLSGKTITIDVVVCPHRQTNIGPDCTRGRIRYDILKTNVLEYKDEVSPSGVVFELDKRVDATEHMRGDQTIRGTYIKAYATASYANNRLGLNTERNRYLNNGTLIQRIIFLVIIEVSSDCTRCSVVRYHIDSAITVPGKPQSRNIELLAQQSCEIRPGV